MNALFLSLEHWEREYIKKKASLLEAGVTLSFADTPATPEHIPADTDAVDVLSVFVDSVVDDSVLAGFPNLKLLATRSTGFDHIDLEAAKMRDVAVANVPSYGEHTVAEYAFALLLTLSRKTYDAYHRIREEGDFCLDGLRGFDLNGKTLGVIGTGRIGRHVIRIAKGFGMEVVAYDVSPDESYAEKMQFTYLPLKDLLGRSDVVTVHVPYRKETHHLLNMETMASMKEGSYLINTSRGGVVETEALVAGLRSGHIAGAALDVLEGEGEIRDELTLLEEAHPEEDTLRVVLQDHALIDMPNVIVTPHNAFNTTGAIERILDTTAENIVQFANGNPVNIVRA